MKPHSRITKTRNGHSLMRSASVPETIEAVVAWTVLVSTILHDTELKAAWRVELAEMRGRLREMRVLLNDALKEKAPDHDFSHLVRARGMFCFLGIPVEQVNRLKKEYGVYMVGSSRINTAGITAHNVNYLADAIAATL